MKELKEKLKHVRLRDITGIAKFLIVLLPAVLKKFYLKQTKKQIWLICETENTARDNGYIFYKFMKENHTNIECYYAINKKSADFKKVEKYGNIINWSSLKHYYYYLSCTKNISSHKEGNPNQTLFTILHLYLNFNNNRVFLQHGVLYQDFPMFYEKNTKFKICIAGAKPEYEFLKTKYGYQNKVKYTGLARFDNLYNNKPDEKMILFIPTWRRWIDSKEELEDSKYFEGICSLLNNIKLTNLLEKYNKYIYFYPHITINKYINDNMTSSKRIKILNSDKEDIQELLKKGVLLITDFSSVFTDFAYMHKPIIYYQYDKEEYLNNHCLSINKTYFNFENDGFGKVTNTEDELLKELEYYLKNSFQERKIYKDKIDNFFKLHDQNNCERIFNVIIGDKNHE